MFSGLIFYCQPMTHYIDDAFVGQLFAHPSFQMRLRQSQDSSRVQPVMGELVEEICEVLSSEYRQQVGE